METIVRDSDETRNFALRHQIDDETSVFTERTLRQAALKVPAARTRWHRGKGKSKDLHLCEKGTHNLQIYEGWYGAGMPR